MKRTAILSLVTLTTTLACGPDDGRPTRQGVPWGGGDFVDADGGAADDAADGGAADDDGDGADDDTAGPSDCVYMFSGPGGCGAPPPDGTVDPDADADDNGPDPADEPDGTGPTPPTSPDPDGWDPALAALEEEMLVLVNDLRARGVDCGWSTMPPVPPLAMETTLRSAARYHSQDMADNGYFDHNSQDGRSPWDRIGQAGYAGMPVGENIAAGNGTAAATFDQWVHSAGHCRNMMSANATEIGIGVAVGGPYGAYWTQTFGAR